MLPFVSGLVAMIELLAHRISFRGLFELLINSVVFFAFRMEGLVEFRLSSGGGDTWFFSTWYNYRFV